MASHNSTETDGWTGRRVDMAEFGARIAARKAELGLPDPPRNAGRNRIPSKHAPLTVLRLLLPGLRLALAPTQSCG